VKAGSAYAGTAGLSTFGTTGLLSLFGIATLPLTLLLLPKVAEVVYILLSVAGLIELLRGHLSHDERHRLLLVSLLPVLFFAIAALSVIVSGDYSGWFHPLKKLDELLATPFIAILLMRGNIKPHHFIQVSRYSVLLLFAAILYQFVRLHVGRPGGAISPLQFAHVALLLGCYSLICLPLESGRRRLFSLAAFCAGFLSTLITQSRIEWISAFVLITALIVIWRRSGLLEKKTVWVVCGITLALSLFSMGTPLVQNRVGAALAEYHAFEDHQVWFSSVGQRLVMWKAGLEAAAEKPVFGWGIHRSQQAAVSKLHDPVMKQLLGEHHNLHNEYVNSLAAKGIVGLLSLLALLFIPMAIFYARADNPELLIFNAGGLLLCVSYAVSSLTYQAFGDNTMNVFFVIVFSYSLTSVLQKPVTSQP